MQRGCDEIVVIMSPTNFAMNVMIIIYLLLSVSLTAASSDNETIIKGDIKSTHTWTAYKSLFKTQRRAHMDAIKTMLSIPSTEKQYDMLNLVTTKMMEILEVSRQRIVDAKLSPSDEFPEEEGLRDSVSQVLQNTFLFGDLSLRFPTFIHRMYDKDSEVKALVKWAFMFTNETGIATGTSANQTLYLASQELRIVKRSEQYINPFKEEAEIKLSKLVQDEMNSKKKKNKKKGPRLSGKTEL